MSIIKRFPNGNRLCFYPCIAEIIDATALIALPAFFLTATLFLLIILDTTVVAVPTARPVITPVITAFFFIFAIFTTPQVIV